MSSTKSLEWFGNLVECTVFMAVFEALRRALKELSNAEPKNEYLWRFEVGVNLSTKKQAIAKRLKLIVLFWKELEAMFIHLVELTEETSWSVRLHQLSHRQLDTDSQSTWRTFITRDFKFVQNRICKRGKYFGLSCDLRKESTSNTITGRVREEHCYTLFTVLAFDPRLLCSYTHTFVRALCAGKLNVY